MSWGNNIAQFDTRLAGEFRVCPEHIDGESDFVDHALAGTVTAGEELQIVDPVILPISVLVVDGFFGEKLSAKMPCHDVTMLKNVALDAADERRNGDIHIPAPSTSKSLYLSAIEALKSNLLLPLRLAGNTAKLLRVIVFGSAGVFLFSHWCNLTALFASKNISLLCVRSSTVGGTRNRTVKRWTIKLFDICRKIGRGYLELLSAVLACQDLLLNSRRRSAIIAFKFSQAPNRAKLLTKIPAPRDDEVCSALLACLHRMRLIFSVIGLAFGAAKPLPLLSGAYRKTALALFAGLRDWHDCILSVGTGGYCLNTACVSITNTGD